MRSSISTKAVRGLRVVVCALAAAVAAACAPSASAATIYAIDDQNSLFTFDNLSPQNIISGVFISGLASNEHLINIDFRPATGQLYGIGSSYTVYTINPATGVATAAGPSFGAVSGNSFGMDFNPIPDRIRFYSDTENNLRLNPVGGAITNTDTSLAYKAGDPLFGQNPSVIGAGYTNSTNPVPATTTLFGIDSVHDRLVRVGGVNGGAPEGSPNLGQLTSLGALPVDTNNFVGFDVSVNNLGFMSLSPAGEGVSYLFGVDLTNPAAPGPILPFGRIIGGVRVVDITVEPGTDFVLPEPATMLSLGSFALLAGLRRRQRA